MADRCTVGVAQIEPRLGDVAANLDLHEAALREARGRGVDLLVFPELSVTGYFLKDQVPAVAATADSATMRRLRALSRETGVAFVAGLVEETPEVRFHNAAMLFDGGEIAHVHRKVYLPTYGLFDELRDLARGDRIRAFDHPTGRAAVLLCEDLWHPSTSYVAAMDRALTVIVPSASPIWGLERGVLPENADYWQRLLRMTAETWGMFVIYANRVGFEDGVGFWGGSEIVDPAGERLARARYYEPDLVVAELDLGAIRRKRLTTPLLRDENLDLTINELTRIRGRELAGVIQDLRRRTMAALAAERATAPAATPAKPVTPSRKARPVGATAKPARARVARRPRTGKAARRR